MWFRRKKKTDANSTLSDTMLSLQSLLDEQPQGASEIPSTTSILGPTPADTDMTSDTLSPPSSDNKNISNAVASDEHLEWDFKVDLEVEDAVENAPRPGFLKPVESETIPELTIPADAAVVPIRPGRTATAETGADNPEPDTGGAIPVLSKIVDPVVDNAPGGIETEYVEAQDSFVSQCLKDIRKRLKRNELTPLTTDQEKQLRTALISLLVQKKSGKFE